MTHHRVQQFFNASAIIWKNGKRTDAEETSLHKPDKASQVACGL